MKKLLAFLIVLILAVGGLNVVGETDDNDYVLKTTEDSIVVSKPVVNDDGEYVNVDFKESTSSLTDIGRPDLPIFTKIFTFPLGTEIKEVDVIFSEQNEIILSKQINPVSEPLPKSVSLQAKTTNVKDIELYENSDLYPTSSYNIVKGSGLVDGKHVLIVAVNCYFIRYLPNSNTIYYSQKADIKLSYKEPVSSVVFDDVYDMVIIAPSEYSNALQPLITHKNNYNLKTVLKTTQSIYSEYDAYDGAEEIKYFIKDAIENWGVSFVLLVGDIDKVPIRTTHCGWWEREVLCDLYYQDIYDSEMNYCSWDGNNNHLYGEVQYDHHQAYDLDDVDLFPDVHVGRLACMNKGEVNLVVDKIIHYEKETYGKSWFKNIVLCGGDTFPGWGGNEGEVINDIIASIMSDFTPKRLWTSDNSFNARNLNKAVNAGAGFVDYSGHGYTNRMGTHPPDDDDWVMYYNINLLGLLNGYELPIVYFDACLTSKLDYNTDETSRTRSKTSINFLTNLLSKPIFRPIKNLFKLFEEDYEPRANPELVSCFSWNWVIKNNGGAIATIGATRTAFGGVDSGAGKMAIEFFNGYDSSERLGEMMSYSQYQYISDVPGDFFTVEEFVLLGDPSLKVGGYP